MGISRIRINSNWCRQKVFFLDKDSVGIGRTPDNDIIFTHQCVSRNHSTITKEGERYFIQDKGSKHGTFVNKVRVKKQELKNGDVIHLGLVRETEMRFLDSDETEPTPMVQWQPITLPKDKSDIDSKDFQLLLEISKAINSTLILEDVLNLVMDAVIQVTQSQNGFLMLINDKGELEFKVARNMQKESLQDDELKVSQSIVKKVAESGEALVSGNVLQDDRFKSKQSILELKLKTVMCVPLKINSQDGTRVIGVIYVHNKMITPNLSKKTLDLLEYMASHSAVAIENAKLHAETKIKERMQKELEIAYQIQTSLLPHESPKIQGLDIFARSIPASEVGGDFYNFIPLSNFRLGVAIGDVIGKSIPAALYMSATNSVLETLLAVKPDLVPRDVIGTTNDMICRKTKGSHFVTLSYGIIDLKKMFFTYSNAGHNYPILLRDGACTELQCNGPALGMFQEDQFESFEITLKSGDFLILYTDGIVEALNKDKKQFGFQQLYSIIVEQNESSAQTLGNAILAAVKSHAQEMKQYDDITLICIRLV